MRNLRYFLTILAGLLAFTCAAQLSTLVPQSMSHQSTPNNGSKQAAHIEIVFSEPLSGVEVVRDSKNSTPDKSFGDTPGKVHAKALAMPQMGVIAKKVTVVHPDFAPCVIVFDSIGFKEDVLAGEHYIIQVDVPEAALVEANKAYYNLDFPAAGAAYDNCLAAGAGNDTELIQQRLAVIKELEDAYSYIGQNRHSSTRATLFRCMKAAQMIQDKTHSPKAYELVKEFRGKLGAKNSAMDDDGATLLRIDTVFLHDADNRPMSDARLPKVDGQPYYSWINVRIDLDDVSFTGGDQFIPAERIDGEYRLYVGKGTEAAGPIEVRHPDCIPFVLRLSDYGISEVKPASVYEVRFLTPPAAMIEADRAFGNLDFPAAKMLYEDMLMNGSRYDDEILAQVNSRLEKVKPLAANSDVKQWKDLRKQVRNAEKYDRDELTVICNRLAAMAGKFAALGIPGMDHKAEVYAKAANDYKNSVYLTVTIYKCDEKGNPVFDSNAEYVPYDGKEICLVFDNVNGIKNYPVHIKQSQKGVFRSYLPYFISDWLMNHPNKKLKVKVRDAGNMKDLGDKFEIFLDGDSRSYAITLYFKD